MVFLGGTKPYSACSKINYRFLLAACRINNNKKQRNSKQYNQIEKYTIQMYMFYTEVLSLKTTTVLLSKYL